MSDLDLTESNLNLEEESGQFDSLIGSNEAASAMQDLDDN
jgi:hypothetical protein